MDKALLSTFVAGLFIQQQTLESPKIQLIAATSY